MSRVEGLVDENLRHRLTEAGIERVVTYIGACDKPRQVQLLESFTTVDRKGLRAGGAGTARARAK